MIVAVCAGRTEGDTPSMFVVDTDKCTPVWRDAILYQLKHNRLYDDPEHTIEDTIALNKLEPPMPDDWEELEQAEVPFPALVEAACHVYYASPWTLMMKGETMAWQVKLVTAPKVNNTYKPDYFPRKFAYKKEAEKLKDEVIRNGGQAIVEKLKETRRDGN